MLISFYLIGKTAISSSTNDTGFCSSHTVTNNFRAYRYPPKTKKKSRNLYVGDRKGSVHHEL